MESRNYATILLVFLAMAEAFSYPRTSNEQHRFPSLGSVRGFNDEEQDVQPSFRKFYEHTEQENSDSHTLLFNGHDGTRVKRDRKPTRGETLRKIYKEARIATLARQASALDTLSRAYKDLLIRFKTIVEGYLSQGNNLTDSIGLFEVNYPELAREIRERRNRRK